MVTKKVTRKRLTKKQHGFVKDYLKTGIGSLAVKKNYNVATDQTARAIAHENLTNPYIVKAIDDALSDEKLRQAHEELMNQARFEYFVFPKAMEDTEIEEKVSAVGVELVVIQPGEKGKYAFYKTIDANARKAAIDMAYKLKGSYAAEKKVNLNIEIEALPEIKALTEQINAIHRGNGIPSDGGSSSVVGEETPNQE